MNDNDGIIEWNCQQSNELEQQLHDIVRFHGTARE